MAAHLPSETEQRASVTGYWLPSHVHFCGRGDVFIFLDLRKDEYTLVNGAAATALRSLLCDNPSVVHTAELAPALGELVQGGLLTVDKAQAGSIIPTEIEVPLSHLIDNEGTGVQIALSDVWGFFFACASAALQLRFRPIEKTVEAVRNRKVRASLPPQFDFRRARDRVRAFRRLRLLFPANYLCLFDSLALVEFLARYNVFPTWVFAVRFEVWGAHCWVQEGAVVFNEGVEETEEYTPIMAI